MQSTFSYVRVPEANSAVGEDLEKLKQRFSLLGYLRQQNWVARPAGHGPEFVGLCPLHPETRPSFYVNARKISSTVTVAARAAISFALSSYPAICLFAKASLTSSSTVFLQPTLLRYSNKPPLLSTATQLLPRGAALSETTRSARSRLDQGNADRLRPRWSLRRHLTAQGYSCDLLRRLGLLNPQGCDPFYRRIVFPCCHGGRVINLFGRSIAAAFAHRFLPGSKGGLYAWEQVQQCPEVILVEGLFDYAVLWQAGFRHLTC